MLVLTFVVNDYSNSRPLDFTTDTTIVINSMHKNHPISTLAPPQHIQPGLARNHSFTLLSVEGLAMQPPRRCCSH